MHKRGLALRKPPLGPLWRRSAGRETQAQSGGIWDVWGTRARDTRVQNQRARPRSHSRGARHPRALQRCTHGPADATHAGPMAEQAVTTRGSLRGEDWVTVPGPGRKPMEDDPLQHGPQPQQTEQWAPHTHKRRNAHRPGMYMIVTCKFWWEWGGGGALRGPR